MKRISRVAALAGATACLAGAVISVASVSAEAPRRAGSTRTTEVGASDEKGLTEAQEKMLAMRAAGEPLPVMDPETGRSSGGFVLDADLDTQNDRVDEDLAELGIHSADDERWAKVAPALMVIEAAPVTTEDGKVIGYLGTHFIPANRHEDAVAAAQAEVDRAIG